MKPTRLKLATFNNRKKQLKVTYTSQKVITVPYGLLGITANIKNVWIDDETRGKSIGIRYENGLIDYMPYDQPLHTSKDPDFLLQTHIELLIAQIKHKLQKQHISKRYLAEQLHTSDNQVQRLLNPSILNKNLNQLYTMAILLEFEPYFYLKAA